MFKTASLEREPDTYVPYIGHAAPNIVMLDDGSLLAMLHIDGMPFETTDPAIINALHAQRNVLLRNIASDRIMLQTHVIRTLTDDSDYPKEKCSSAFACSLDTGYQRRLMSNRLFRNELFLSILLRSSNRTNMLAGKITSLFTGRHRRNSGTSSTNLEYLSSTVSTLIYELKAYGAQQLGLREKNGLIFSEIAEALRLIITGERLPVPLVNGHLGGAIYTDRVIVGHEAIEIRGAGESGYAAIFGLREYPAVTWPGMFDIILSAPYRCVLTQSFGFLEKQTAQDIMTRKQNQMLTAQDKAASQTEELTDAADMLASNAFVMGDHHLSLMTFADSLNNLRDVAASARRDLAESGAVIVREDLALEAAYWAQLPGNMRLRSRPGVISSRNFAAMASLHNYPQGAQYGFWGEHLTIFRSSGGTPYRFHLHAPTETVKDLGNIFLAGPAGSGKTTLMLFLLAMAERQKVITVLFDKDRGGDILSRAVGGKYLVLPSGEPSGLAPLKALDNSPANIEFIKELVKGLVIEIGKNISPEDERRLGLGVHTVMTLPTGKRSFKELRAFLGQSDPDGMGAKLEKWCKGGTLGWVLDNDKDRVSLDTPFLGFDITAVLDDPITRGPILSYLFHRLEKLLNGRRLVLAIDEFWKVLLDPKFRDLVNNQLKTIRKRNGLIILATQSPADALRSPIAHSIIEQCPTQILMPNTRADAKDYMEGLKLTESEFLAIREDLTVGGHRFLLKQGNTSIVCELDLSGLDNEIAVISGRANTIRLMEKLIDQVGPETTAWLPLFQEQWREVRN